MNNSGRFYTLSVYINGTTSNVQIEIVNNCIRMDCAQEGIRIIKIKDNSLYEVTETNKKLLLVNLHNWKFKQIYDKVMEIITGYVTLSKSFDNIPTIAKITKLLLQEANIVYDPDTITYGDKTIQLQGNKVYFSELGNIELLMYDSNYRVHLLSGKSVVKINIYKVMQELSKYDLVGNKLAELVSEMLDRYLASNFL